MMVKAISTQGVKYAGSKLKLIPYIVELMDSLDGVQHVLDGFSGTTRVSQAFAQLGYNTTANDISAWSFDPELKEALLEHRPGYVLMHCKGRPADMQRAPQYQNVVDEVYAFLERKLDELVRGGFPEKHVLIDPGIGFGKNLKHNLKLLAQIEKFQALGRPLLIGISYKSFLGEISGAPLNERGALSATASALLAARGVWAHRVHDVRETRQALELTRALNGPEASCL